MKVMTETATEVEAAYKSYTKNQASFRFNLYFNMYLHYKDISLDLKKVIQFDFKADTTEIKTDLDVEIETRYEIKNTLISQIAKVQINPTVWTIQIRNCQLIEKIIRIKSNHFLFYILKSFFFIKMSYLNKK